MDKLINALDNFFNKQMGMRRLMVLWAGWLITVVVLRVTEPAVLAQVNGSVATIVTAVIGILATSIGFYKWTRHKDAERNTSKD